MKITRNMEYLLNKNDFLCLCESQPSNPEIIDLFIPGFGVNLFGSTQTDEIAEVVKIAYKDILPNEHASVFFELQNYSSENYNTSYALTFEEQSQRLKKVLIAITDKFPNSKINITAQSIGCLALIPLIEFLQSNNFLLHNLALWGPPTLETDNHAERLSGAFINREGTIINLKGKSILQCKDQKKLIVEKEFWESLSRNTLVTNLKNISSLFSSVFLFFASEDKLYPDDILYYKNSMTDNCILIPIKGDSHTFRKPEMIIKLRDLMIRYYLKQQS